MRGKITIIGCPKLDDIDYSEKLTEIIRQNDIKSVTIVRMEVPCCGGRSNQKKRKILTVASCNNQHRRQKALNQEKLIYIKKSP